ncbi:dermonecrotic toxin [Bordetella bronchiseptica]|uniref:dermonecrotic toxin n=1 Tax=Bordetella bronchiseptica TaxID=518 RepID=UPI0004A0E8F7|nr:dermonecrotic toxin [Bordetella bronchiseptica]KDC70176.1 cytotoxic necrotizing factor [Bordetella bronchiseptica MBORD632]
MDKDESALRQLVDMALVGYDGVVEELLALPSEESGDLAGGRAKREKAEFALFGEAPNGDEPIGQDARTWFYYPKYRPVAVSNLKKMQVAIRARLEPESLILQWLIALDVYLGVLIAALSRTAISDLVFEYVKARYEIYYLLNRVPHPLAAAYLKRRRQRPVDRSGRLGSVFEHPLWFAYDELAGTVDLDADIYEQALAESIERRMDGEPDDGSLDTTEHDVWRLCRDGINRGEQAIFQASGPYGVVADAGYMRTVADLAYADALADCLHAQLRIRAQGSVDSPGDEMPRKLDAWEIAKFHLAATQQARVDLLEAAFALDYAALRDVRVYGDYRNALALRFIKREALRLLGARRGNASTMPAVAAGEYDEIVASGAANDAAYVSMAAALIAGVLCDLESAQRTLPVVLARFRPLGVLARFRRLEQETAGMLLGDQEPEPRGFISFTDFRDSDAFASYAEYAAQFNDYIDQYSILEAQRLARILALGSRMTVDQWCLPLQKVRHYKVLTSQPGLIARGIENHNRGIEYCLGRPPLTDLPGLFTMFQLHDSSWLLVSNINGELWSDVLANAEVMQNPTLAALAEPQGRFRTGRRTGGWFLGGPATEGPSLRDNYLLKLRRSNPGLDVKKCWYFGYRQEYRLPAGALGVPLFAVSVALRHSLDDLAAHAKSALYKPSEWQKFAFWIVPFYREIFFSTQDRSYRVDVGSIVFDSISLLASVFSIGGKLGSFTRTQYGNLRNFVVRQRIAGLSGQRLWRSVLKELPALIGASGLRLSRSLLVDLYEIFEPVPIRRLVAGFVSATTVGGRNQAFLRQAFSAASSSAGRTGGQLASEWRMAGVDATGLVESTSGGRFEGIYTRGLGPLSERTEHFIVESGNAYRVIWDAYTHGWRVVNGRLPPRLTYTVPVRLNGQGHWETHLDVPGRGGAPEIFGRIRTRNLVALAAEQAAPMRRLLNQARRVALRHIDTCRSRLASPRAESDMDAAIRIFFGEPDAGLRQRIGRRLQEVRAYIGDLSPVNDVLYRAGYDLDDVATLFNAVDRNTSLGRQARMELYLDAIVDLHARLGYENARFVDLMAFHLLSLGHAATASEVVEAVSPRLLGNVFDISNVAQLERGIGNPASTGLFVMLGAYSESSPAIFQSFVNDIFPAWRQASGGGPLVWNFGPAAISPTRLDYANTDIGLLNHGDISPLRARPPLGGRRDIDLPPGLDISFVRYDRPVRMSAPRALDASVFRPVDGPVHGYIQSWTGAEIEYAYGAPVAAREVMLTDNVRIISIENGDEGAIGVRVRLDTVPVATPLILTGGSLSGCTTMVGVKEGCLAFYHTGKSTELGDWATAREGVQALYQAHLAMGYAPISIPAPMRNDDLVSIAATYDRAVIAYLGKDVPGGGSTRITRHDAGAGSVVSFDYNAAVQASAVPRLGQVYVLISNDGQGARAVLLAEDLAWAGSGSALDVLNERLVTLFPAPV